MGNPTSDLISTGRADDQLIQLISKWIFPLGYQVIHLEIQSHRQKTLRVYIDFLEFNEEKTIGIEDCVKVSRAIDELLDQSPEVGTVLSDAYELEVSSPGVDRPLRTMGDFQRFAGREVRIHVYRALTSEELDNAVYHEKNSKQKNFIGTLMGADENKVVLAISSKDKKSQAAGKKSAAKKKANLKTNSVEGIEIRIPLPLISKANLEPEFNFEGSDERE